MKNFFLTLFVLVLVLAGGAYWFAKTQGITLVFSSLFSNTTSGSDSESATETISCDPLSVIVYVKKDATAEDAKNAEIRTVTAPADGTMLSAEENTKVNQCITNSKYTYTYGGIADDSHYKYLVQFSGLPTLKNKETSLFMVVTLGGIPYVYNGNPKSGSVELREATVTESTTTQQ